MTQGAKTPHEILGIPPEASLEDIRRAYHAGALKYHPDNHHADPAKVEKDFRILAKAYKAALRAHIPKFQPEQNKPYSPADFARMNTKWHSDRSQYNHDPNHADQWTLNTPTSKTVPTLDENRVFVVAWAIATVLSVVVVLLSGALGLFGNLEDGMDFSDILVSELLGLVTAVLIIAIAIYGIILTRKTILMTLQLGVRLLPFLPKARKLKQLPTNTSDQN
ncbi:MAG: J domain-containing protein [Phycisphaerales bacterium]|jgi:hypothetical protein|nr:J domain-containing protein [Phycisphaerales bacterium]